jgi:hypothetical protein
VAWTILRPTLIYVEGRDANVSRLAGLIRRFKVLPLSGGARACASRCTPTTWPTARSPPPRRRPPGQGL